MPFLRAQDTISGQEGRAYATINGVVEEMFYVTNIEATAEKNKAEIRTLGRRGVQNKTTGWTGTGSMTIYYITSRFRQLMLDYIKNGIDTYFDITITNEDPTSATGRQTITLRDVNLNSVVLASLNTDAEALTEDVEFTFEDVDMPEVFNAVTPG